MPISIKEIEHIALLARLDLSKEEIEFFTHQLNSILEYVKKLKELNVEDINPTTHVLELQTPLRGDIVKESLSPEEALADAPAQERGHFRVPKVIE